MLQSVDKLGLMVTFVYFIVELLEKFGLDRKFARLTAIPLGICSSFSLLHCMTIREYLVKGFFIGIGAVGACDSVCNIIATVKEIIIKRTFSV